ncbi:MAG: hypothetical protein K6F09_01705, partial [Clostridiales bacterium]|nr:hypothetical protein [Clostridiales bacterium]
MKKILFISAGVFCVAASAFYFRAYTDWVVPLYALGVALYSLASCFIAACFSKSPVKAGVIAGLGYAAGNFGLS